MINWSSGLGGYLIKIMKPMAHPKPKKKSISVRNWSRGRVSTPAEKSIFLLFIFPRYRPPFGEYCMCVISISFPFRDMSCVCMGTYVHVCV